jgi:3-isopropylmalate dehydratase large subunit
MGATLAEKILANASGKRAVKAGDYVTARPDFVMSGEAAAGIYFRMMQANADTVWDNKKIILFLDHYTPAPSVRSADIQKMVREFARRFKLEHFYGERAGICHQALPELGFVAPGRFIVGADSHSTTYGAFGCAGTGIGYTEMAYIFYTGELWFNVPETVQFHISGRPGRYVMGKDIILHIAGRYSTTAAQYKSVEFHGPALKNLPLSCRMTMANMSVEIGAKFGLFQPDAAVFDFLRGRVKGDYRPLYSDPDADYCAVHEVDIRGLSPQVARHPRVDDVVAVETVEEINIDQAYLGSCTNGRLEDLAAAAEILKGRKVHDAVRLIITPASYEIYKQAMQSGILATLIDAGGCICHPGCGACFGGHMGILASGETCISTTNRNFIGRMGSPEAKIFLSNPYVVAASAVAGKIIHPDRLPV